MPHRDPQPLTLSVADVARLYNVKASTVRKWARIGQLPPPDGHGRKSVWLTSTIIKHLKQGRKVGVAS